MRSAILPLVGVRGGAPAEMRPLLRIAWGIDRANRLIGRAAAVLCGAMVLLGAYNAVARTLEKRLGLALASNAWIEGQWYLFGLVFLLGAAHALQRNAHVRVDVLYGRLPDRGKVWLDLCGTVLFLLPFCAFALWFSWPSVRNSWAAREVSPDPGGLARYPIKSAILAGFALLLLQGLSDLVKRVAWLAGVPLPDGALPEIEPGKEGE